MGTALHIMQVVKWDKFTLEEWLTQLGAWCGSCAGTRGGGDTLLARLIDKAEREKNPLKSHRSIVRCEITDDEARAVQKILLDAQGIGNEFVNQWMRVLISRYLYNNSWNEMADQMGESSRALRTDAACGLAFLKGRNSFLL